jgi:hypothetical protein
MAEMLRSTSTARLGSEFNDFLFAPVGEDRSGMPLSVLSALARQDIDPWQEAANLAGLTKAFATLRLASMIAALPDGPSAHREPETIAARLIALLPRRARVNIPSPKTLLGAGAVTISPAATCVISCVIVMAVMLGAQCIIASYKPPTQVDTAHAPVSRTVSQYTPPSNGGQRRSSGLGQQEEP